MFAPYLDSGQTPFAFPENPEDLLNLETLLQNAPHLLYWIYLSLNDSNTQGSPALRGQAKGVRPVLISNGVSGLEQAG
jgi:hypothetical protein